MRLAALLHDVEHAGIEVDRRDLELLLHGIGGADRAGLFVEALADLRDDAVDILLCARTHVDAELRRTGDDVHCARRRLQVADGRDGPLAALARHLVDVRDDLRSNAHGVFAHMHRRRARVVGAAVDRNHVALDADDAVDEPQLDRRGVEHRALLDVRLDEARDAARLPGGAAKLLRVKAVGFHRVVDRDVVLIGVRFALLHGHLAEHAFRAEIARTEAAALLVHERGHDEVLLELAALFEQHARRLNRTDDARNAVVVAAVVDGIVVRAHHDARQAAVFAAQHAEHVAHAVLAHLQARLRHDLFEVFGGVARLFGKRHPRAAVSGRCRKGLHGLQILFNPVFQMRQFQFLPSHLFAHPVLRAHDPRAVLTRQSLLHAVDRCDDRYAAALLHKLHGRLNFRAHAASRELPLGKVPPAFVERHRVKFALLRRTEIDRNLRHTGQNHERVGARLLRDEGGSEIFVDDRLYALQLAVFAHDRDPAAADRDDQKPIFRQRADGRLLDKLKRAR